MRVTKRKLANVYLAMLGLSILMVGCTSESSTDGSKVSMAPLGLTLETNKATYEPGESVTIRLTAINKGDSALQLTFPSAQKYDFVITKGEQQVWRWARDKMFAMVITQVTLSPSESAIYEEKWHQKDNVGNPVPSGTYQVIGLLKADPEKASSAVAIEIKAK